MGRVGSELHLQAAVLVFACPFVPNSERISITASQEVGRHVFTLHPVYAEIERECTFAKVARLVFEDPQIHLGCRHDHHRHDRDSFR